MAESSVSALADSLAAVEEPVSELRGYDVDGVLVPCKVEPRHPYVVITGRKFHEFPRTLIEVGICSAVYCRPNGIDGDHQAAGEWKATMINLLEVTEFYEDTPLQAEIIRERCPGCRVVLVT